MRCHWYFLNSGHMIFTVWLGTVSFPPKFVIVKNSSKKYVMFLCWYQMNAFLPISITISIFEYSIFFFSSQDILIVFLIISSSRIFLCHLLLIL